MLEEKQSEINTEQTLEDAVDNSLASLPIPLDEKEKVIVNNIVTADTRKELQEQFELFNMNQSKKNALRIIKLQGLLGQVEDQAIERFAKRPDQISNRELLDYMQIVSAQIDRSQKQIDTLQDRPTILVKNEKTEVNVNVATDLDRDAKKRVLNAVAELIRQAKEAQEVPYVDLTEEKSEETTEEPKKIGIINVDEEK